MIFAPTLLYKVTELKGALVITQQWDSVKRDDAVELMAGPAAAVAEWLARYMHAREAGKDMDAAHKEALRGAQIVQIPKGAA